MVYEHAMPACATQYCAVAELSAANGVATAFIRMRDPAQPDRSPHFIADPDRINTLPPRLGRYERVTCETVDILRIEV